MEQGVVLVVLALWVGCSAQLTLNIQEEVQPDTLIGDVTDIEGMLNNVTSSQKQALRFNIIQSDTHPASLFRVEESSGQLYVKGRIDRESLCNYIDKCSVEFDVAILSTSPSFAFSNVATITVLVADINDNSPTFPAAEVTLNVSELASVGTVLKISGAVDRDSLSTNTISSYQLSKHNDLFTLTTFENLDRSSVINLKLEQTLDHEVAQRYQFNIVALDGGSPPRSGVLAVTINVIDENDNSPRFLNSTYALVVREDAAINSTVLTVTATDPDAGNNGKVRYQFSSLQSSKMQALFTIDSVTGDIKVAGKLEYDNKPHQLIVEAIDSGATPLKTQIVITVTVLDSGNNRPVVKVNSLTTGNTVPEKSGLGTFVAVVEVEDSDSGENGDVVCTISTRDFALEPLSGKNRYKVLVNSELDRESQEVYNMTVTCQDKGSPPLTGLATFQMHITDVNDHAPVFEREEYTVSIPENSDIGFSVVSLSASDADLGVNADLRYYVVESSTNPSFRIQHQTGIITTNRKFDREVEPIVQVRVLAIDQGVPAMTGTAVVTLHVTDVNDQFPAFTHQLFHFKILENVSAPTIVGNITAIDKDAGRNGEVEYFMAESPDGIIPFKVLRNGTVIATDTLDREDHGRYIFTVLARDKGSPPKTNSSEVSITVLDKNDNTPQILFPTTYNHTVFISKVPETNAVIGKIVAYDPDFGDNATLNFLISSGNDEGIFAIDSTTGETKVVDVLGLENNKVYDLTITVHDSGTPQLMTDTHLIIDVEFDNDTSVIAPIQQRSEKYLIIAAVVASATIVLSIIIIAAICFVLRSDHHKPFHMPSMFRTRSRPHAMPVKTQIPNQQTVTAPSHGDNRDHDRRPSHSDINSSTPRGNKMAEQPYKKKEVSFSIDETLDVKPRDLIFQNSRLTFLDDKDKILHLDEVNSDTSGETIPSDSGRGGSEEEVNIHPDKKGQMNRWISNDNKNLSFDQCFPMQHQHSANMYNNSTNNPSRFMHTNSFHDGRVGQKGLAPVPRDYQYRSGHSTFHPRPPSDYSRPLGYHRQASVLSHDDDASTTTSGSYTINPDDLTVEDRILGKDVIV